MKPRRPIWDSSVSLRCSKRIQHWRDYHPEGQFTCVGNGSHRGGLVIPMLTPATVQSNCNLTNYWMRRERGTGRPPDCGRRKLREFPLWLTWEAATLIEQDTRNYRRGLPEMATSDAPGGYNVLPEGGPSDSVPRPSTSSHGKARIFSGGQKRPTGTSRNWHYQIETNCGAGWVCNHLQN